jgi:methylated-DNA-[protein]-cysteine S-methyltransferase
MPLYFIFELFVAGYVSTYKLISEVLGTSPRAVGNALRANPFNPHVPCHRVIASNYFIGIQALSIIIMLICTYSATAD